MDFVQEKASFGNRFTPWGVSDRSKVAKGGREFTSFDEFGIKGCGGDVFLVAEATASKYAMEFERIKLCAGFYSRGSGIRRNRREIGWIGVDRLK
jgi:hypothetical protein